MFERMFQQPLLPLFGQIFVRRQRDVIQQKKQHRIRHVQPDFPKQERGIA